MNQRKDGTLTGMGFGIESPNEGAKDEWLTPPPLLHALGKFDLDPCAPIAPPWKTAERQLTIADNGLTTNWGGPDVRVWLNPPYGRETGAWLKLMAQHGNGIALIFARTETQTFDTIWQHASGYLFISRRLKFFHVDGSESNAATAPSVLISFDNEASGGANRLSLHNSGIRGGFQNAAIPIGYNHVTTQQTTLEF